MRGPQPCRHIAHAMRVVSVNCFGTLVSDYYYVLSLVLPLSPLLFAVTFCFVCYYYYMPVNIFLSAAFVVIVLQCCKVFHSHNSAAILCLLFALLSFLLLIVTCNVRIYVYAVHIEEMRGVGSFVLLAYRITSDCVTNGVRVFGLVRPKIFYLHSFRFSDFQAFCSF